jgi:hypothetical protein
MYKQSTSPQLHHPVPVHPIPPINSPPPPQQHHQQAYVPQHDPQSRQRYAQFFDGPQAQMGFQVANSVVERLQGDVEQNVDEEDECETNIYRLIGISMYLR